MCSWFSLCRFGNHKQSQLVWARVSTVPELVAFRNKSHRNGGAKWKELPGASANSTGQVTTTTTVTDGDSTNQTTTFCSCGIISHTKTETTVFATPDEEITITISTETIEGRTKAICRTTKRPRREEATTPSSSGSKRKSPPTEEELFGRSEAEPEVDERSDENRPSATRISRKGVGNNYKKK